MISYRCSHCGQQFEMPESEQESVVCPKCLHISDRQSASVVMPSPVAASKKTSPLDEPRLTRPAADINMEELIDMTAMVDIVFFLLIFFLVTSMSEIQSSSRMPQPNSQQTEGAAKGTQSETNLPSDPHDVVINIGEDDLIRIEGTTYHDKAELLERLKFMQARGDRDMAVLIVGHSNATHGTLAAVLDTAYEAGLNRLRFAVTEQNVD